MSILVDEKMKQEVADLIRELPSWGIDYPISFKHLSYLVASLIEGSEQYSMMVDLITEETYPDNEGYFNFLMDYKVLNEKELQKLKIRVKKEANSIKKLINDYKKSKNPQKLSLTKTYHALYRYADKMGLPFNDFLKCMGYDNLIEKEVDKDEENNSDS